MAQDTRKDPRAKVLSMTVRYKSATIDEFIEHHSHDVSRGGIFIKTPSPFPPGTLLKFEIRIQDEQSVLAGVGRVVWKREATQANDELPSGMGVKFIKIDDKSKGIIGKLVEAQDGKTSTFEAGLAGAPTAGEPAAAKTESVPPKAETAAAKRGGTMLGLGGIGGAGAQPAAEIKSAPPPPPPPAEEPSFFPKTNPAEEMPPPEERTMMKQAAELLQQALAEAGGSLEEISAGLKEEAKPAEKAPEAKPVALDLPVVEAEKKAEAKAPEKEPEAKPLALDLPVESEKKAADKEPEKKAAAAASKGETKAAPEKKAEPEKKPAAAPKPAPAAVAAKPAPEEGSGSSKLLMGLLAAAVIGGGVLLMMTQKGGDSGGTEATSKPTVVAPKPTAIPATTVVPAATAATTAPSASASAATSASAAPATMGPGASRRSTTRCR